MSLRCLCSTGSSSYQPSMIGRVIALIPAGLLLLAIALLVI